MANFFNSKFTQQELVNSVGTIGGFACVFWRAQKNPQSWMVRPTPLSLRLGVIALAHTSHRALNSGLTFREMTHAESFSANWAYSLPQPMRVSEGLQSPIMLSVEKERFFIVGPNFFRLSTQQQKRAYGRALNNELTCVPAVVGAHLATHVVERALWSSLVGDRAGLSKRRAFAFISSEAMLLIVKRFMTRGLTGAIMGGAHKRVH